MEQTECILIVEDNIPILEMVTDTLEMMGFKTVTSEDLKEAREKIKEKVFDLALVDVMLPDGSGLDLVLDIKAASPETPIIICTAYGSMESAITALNRGAYGYVTKPYQMDTLRHIVNQALGRRRLELENRRLLENLKLMNKLKSAFVSNVSHEFKSPLAIIKGWLSYLKESPSLSGPPEVKTVLGRIDQTVDRLNRLVKDLLDIQKIEAGRMELKKEPVNLTKLMKEIMEIYSIAVQEKKLVLKTEFADSVAVTGDKDRLTQAFINLLSNAIKYTPEGGHVTVRLKPPADEVRVEFQDSGPGISPENLEKVFDKFVRVTQEKVEGTGLGLPIASDIIRLHGGKVWVESEVGKGSNFIVVIPKK